ncbi:MAG TPA: CHASE2 domain-containing protein, partial [Pseudomonadales bacterium]|nr:CHASE2 domain-containing protein [Pseudomonadales bacterium]
MTLNTMAYAAERRAARALASILLVTVTGGLLGLTEPARSTDGILSDRAAAMLAWTGERPAVVVIATEGSSDGAALLALVDAARAAGARATAVMQLPDDTDASLRSALAARSVVLGLPSDASILPAAVGQAQLRIGITDLPTDTLGSLRRAYAEARVGGGTLATLPDALAAAAGTNSGRGTSFLVNFFSAERLPILSDAQVRAGNLIPELVQGRVVLIGRAVTADQGRLSTPIGAMSAAEFQAWATDTLLRDRVIRELPLWLHWLLLFAVASGSLQALAVLGNRGIWFTAGTLGVTAVAVALAPLVPVRLPIIELIIVQLLALAVSMRIRAVRTDRSLQQLIRDYGQRLLKRSPTQDFLYTREYWQQLLLFVDQTLELDRVLFLERDPDAHRVREIAANGCSIDDIDEQRRDYDREPYRSAIAARAPVLLTSPFLVEKAPEQQYLMPLSFAGEVYGFWALSTPVVASADRDAFEQAIMAYGNQIAEMLHQRRQWHLDDTARALQGSGGEGAKERPRVTLQRTLAAVDRRLSIFEDAFASQSTATIVYDLFGQVVQLNRAMTTLLSELGFAAYDKTALDLLKSLLDADAAHCRRMLRYVITSRRPFTIPSLQLVGEDGGMDAMQTFQLTIGPVGAAREPGGEAGSVRPFQIGGLMIELQNVSDLHRLNELRGDLLERLGFRLRGDAESIMLATSLLEDESLDSE